MVTVFVCKWVVRVCALGAACELDERSFECSEGIVSTTGSGVFSFITTHVRQ